MEQSMLTDFLHLAPFSDILNFVVPYAGVGGGVEAKEHVALAPLIKYTLIFLAAVGSIFGLGLAIAAKKFAVTMNPKVEQVKEVLAHAH
jgi:electron transport complex protein RnfB